MKAIVLTHKGLEDVSALEIKEILGLKSEKKETAVFFSPKSMGEICKFSYQAQSVLRAGFLLAEFSFKDFEDLKELISAAKISLKEWLDKDTKIAARCISSSEEVSSQETEPFIGEVIINLAEEQLNFTPKVDLKNPDITFGFYATADKAYLFVDFCGFDLSTRDYKIYSTSASIKGTVAYSLIRISELGGSEIMLNPLANDGMIPIEAALYLSSKSPNFFRKKKFAFLKLNALRETDFDKFFSELDKEKTFKAKIIANDPLFNHVSAAQKNAKISGVNKMVTISRIELEWLDTKFDKNSADKIICHLPDISKKRAESDVKKLYNEFFYQTEFILKKEGSITTLTAKTEALKEAAEKYKLKCVLENEIWSGQQKMIISMFRRDKESSKEKKS